MAEDITGRIVRHLFNLKHFENDVALRIGGILAESEAETIALIESINLGGPKTFGGKRNRLKAFSAKLRTIINDNFNEVGRVVRSDLRALVKIEAEFATGTLKAAVAEPGITIAVGELTIGPDLLRRLVDEEPYRGLRLTEWWSREKTATKVAFNQRLTIGMLEGESTQQLVRRIHGTRALNFRDGIFPGMSRRQTEAVVRTAVNQISNRANFLTYKSNSRITKKYRYVATLDARTTEICQALDGREFSYRTASPTPPQHVGCRSTTVPIIDFKGLGIKPPPAGTRPAKAPGGKVVRVRSSTDYGQWLRQQSASVQNEILGPTRGKLFRQGKVTLQDLVRRDGRRLTLEQLGVKLNG